MIATRFAIATILIVMYYPTPAVADPDSYDDCLLENLQGTTSDAAVRGIYQACRTKFPEIKPESIPIPDDVRSKISIRGGLKNSYMSQEGMNEIFGEIYNGSTWAITGVDFVVTDVNEEQGKTYNYEIPYLPIDPDTNRRINELLIMTVSEGASLRYTTIYGYPYK